MKPLNVPTGTGEIIDTGMPGMVPVPYLVLDLDLGTIDRSRGFQFRLYQVIGNLGKPNPQAHRTGQDIIILIIHSEHSSILIIFPLGFALPQWNE